MIHSYHRSEIYNTRGNCLGGSSAANTMVYFRGSKRDFDQWGNELGLKGWSYKDVLPYFKKYENNIDVADRKVHGHNGKERLSPVTRVNLSVVMTGPINITIAKKHFPSPATDEYTAAALRLGIHFPSSHFYLFSLALAFSLSLSPFSLVTFLIIVHRLAKDRRREQP
jgi:choline dehydrogenase-like flavoprotein